jgi:hypothetical protein
MAPVGPDATETLKRVHLPLSGFFTGSEARIEARPVLGFGDSERSRDPFSPAD